MQQNFTVTGPIAQPRNVVAWEAEMAAVKYGRVYFASALSKGEVPSDTIVVIVESEDGNQETFRVRCRIEVQAEPL